MLSAKVCSGPVKDAVAYLSAPVGGRKFVHGYEKRRAFTRREPIHRRLTLAGVILLIRRHLIDIVNANDIV